MRGRNGFSAGDDVRIAGVGVARHDETDGAEEFSRDGGHPIQCGAGVESSDGQFGKIHLPAMVIGGDGRRGYHKDVAEDGHEPHLDTDDLSFDFLHISIVGGG